MVSSSASLPNALFSPVIDQNPSSLDGAACNARAKYIVTAEKLIKEIPVLLQQNKWKEAHELVEKATDRVQEQAFTKLIPEKIGDENEAEVLYLVSLASSSVEICFKKRMEMLERIFDRIREEQAKSDFYQKVIQINPETVEREGLRFIQEYIALQTQPSFQMMKERLRENQTYIVDNYIYLAVRIMIHVQQISPIKSCTREEPKQLLRFVTSWLSHLSDKQLKEHAVKDFMQAYRLLLKRTKPSRANLTQIVEDVPEDIQTEACNHLKKVLEHENKKAKFDQLIDKIEKARSYQKELDQELSILFTEKLDRDCACYGICLLFAEENDVASAWACTMEIQDLRMDVMKKITSSRSFSPFSAAMTAEKTRNGLIGFNHFKVRNK